MKGTFQQRLRQLETRLEDGSRLNEIMKDVEQRYICMEEDQRKARELLHSSLQDQIRLEHSTVLSQTGHLKDQWDREVKARQAHQENYKDLLQQERSSRESQSTHLGHRFENFERVIQSEIQRLWREVGKEQLPNVIQQPPAKNTRQEVIHNSRQEVVYPGVSPRLTSSPSRLASTAAHVETVTAARQEVIYPGLRSPRLTNGSTVVRGPPTPLRGISREPALKSISLSGSVRSVGRVADESNGSSPGSIRANIIVSPSTEKIEFE
jgi:hypothetical protein